ncbi:hypothetical protein NL676_028598 [Syzygium grande]|nr:hypothetical protein NL676_028598 [Syzygium grande]
MKSFSQNEAGHDPLNEWTALCRGRLPPAQLRQQQQQERRRGLQYTRRHEFPPDPPMKSFSKTKRVTTHSSSEPLFVGADRHQLSYASSGSENDGEDCSTPLSELVQCVLEEGEGCPRVHSLGHVPDSDRADSVPTSSWTPTTSWRGL